MKSVKCKECGCDIFTEYSSIGPINMPSSEKKDKYFSELRQTPTEDCNIGIYLTCENNHVKKYFCKTEEKIKL